MSMDTKVTLDENANESQAEMHGDIEYEINKENEETEPKRKKRAFGSVETNKVS